MALEPLIGRACGAALTLIVFAAPTCSPAATLPQTIPAHASPVTAVRGWTIPDMVEVTRITGTAIDGAGERAAFLLKQPSIASGGDHYALYVIDMARPGSARKLIEAGYLADLQWRPGARGWTLRGDFGDGVQVYDVDDDGRRAPVVVNPDLADVGGADGQATSASDPVRRTGVLAYGWNADGSALWYVRLVPRSPVELAALRDEGLVFEDGLTPAIDFFTRPTARRVELRVLEPAEGRDRLAALAPGDRSNATGAVQNGSVAWADVRHLSYSLVTQARGGRISVGGGRFALVSGETTQAPAAAGELILYGAPTPRGHLVVRRDNAGGRRLVEIGPDGEETADHGAVAFSALGGYWGAWRAADGRAIYGVRHPDRSGLVFLPRAPNATIEAVAEHLDNCAFSTDLTVGVCSRETLTRPPELVMVAPKRSRIEILARPNARYDTIPPLRNEPAIWTNRFGVTSRGYVTYPRHYQPGRRYPAVVITHASDAQNRFVDAGFQWAFPLQSLAERGYVVLSVNESSSDPAASSAYAFATTDLEVGRMQKAMGLEAVATMEAAVQSQIDRGLVDRDRVGIAGYSRGGIVTTLALSQSDVFRAGINADTAFFSAGGFWRGGRVRETYRTLFGGSPLDPRHLPAYRAFSPSARGERFAGPLLQIFTGVTAPTALELDQALREARVPTDLIAYPDETHILHRPRSIASAAARTLDWFDFWLRNRADPDPAKAAQYERWQVQAERWRSVETEQVKGP